MIITARPVPGRPGTVDLLADGIKVDEVHCRQGSARVSDGQIEFTAVIRCKPYSDSMKNEKIPDKVEEMEDNGSDSREESEMDPAL